jgi:hypothetical protein
VEEATNPLHSGTIRHGAFGMKALPYEKGTEHNHETDEKLHLEILLPPSSAISLAQTAPLIKLYSNSC